MISGINPLDVSINSSRDPRSRNNKLSNSDVRMFESCVKEMSPSSAEANKKNDKSLAPTEPREMFKQYLLQNADRYVNMPMLERKIKNTASRENLENLKRSAVNMMRDGLLEYMRQAVEELIEIGRSSRNLNVLFTKNITAG